MNKDKICSYCNREDITVHRHMFDGLCARCTDAALYSVEVSRKAKARNEQLKEGRPQ